VDGLGGVEGMPPPDATRIANANALEAMARAVRGAEGTVVIVASGPLTNVALFVAAYPELLEKVAQIVFMGGGIGIGNRSSVAGASACGSAIHHALTRARRMEHPMRS
jgi:uridine nucleosidase